jgi:hypothetical protein
MVFQSSLIGMSSFLSPCLRLCKYAMAAGRASYEVFVKLIEISAEVSFSPIRENSGHNYVSVYLFSVIPLPSLLRIRASRNRVCRMLGSALSLQSRRRLCSCLKLFEQSLASDPKEIGTLVSLWSAAVRRLCILRRSSLRPCRL